MVCATVVSVVQSMDCTVLVIRPGKLHYLFLSHMFYRFDVGGRYLSLFVACIINKFKHVMAVVFGMIWIGM